MKISIEMAENMGYLPSPLNAAYRSVEGMYVFGKNMDSRFEDAYRKAEKQIWSKYSVDERLGVVDVPEVFLRENGYRH